VNNSLIELQELLGVSEINNFDIEIIEIEVASEKLRLNSISEGVINSNPTIKSSAFDLELKKRDLKISRSSFYPRINLNYSYSTNYFHILGRDDVVFNQETGQFDENGFLTQLNNNRTHFISLSVNVPIFNRFQTRENYKKAQEEIKISEIVLANQKLLLKNKVKTAMNDSNTAKATLESNKVAYQSQNEAFDILNEQYKNGNITNYEFLQGKTKLIKDTSEFIRSKYDYLFKNKILEFYNVYETD
jgi:outer membrane protein